MSMAGPRIRRIVTGHDEQGKSVILSDGPAPRVFTLDGRGSAFVELWTTLATPAPIDRASGEPVEQGVHLFPPANGTRLRIVDFPPEDENVLAQLTPDAVRAAFTAINAASAIPDGPSPHPLMHRHQTVDYGLVLEGELVLVLDGSETPLRAGDIVIQRGTSHAWANRSGRPARMAFILIDGAYEAELSDGGGA
jgi:mannose-6-phosphate isomerase-like protein (cupin superfamily)